jgi:phage tail sheath protein FI
VYVEEVQGAPPIVGVGTSTAAFIGFVDTGAAGWAMPTKPDNSGPYALAPVDDPRPVADFTQFKNQFGDLQAGNRVLAHAVSGFFLNGGTYCYVIRTADLASPAKVGATLQKLESIDEIAIVAAPGARDAGVQTAIAQHCSRLKSRFAILDGQVVTPPTEAGIKGGVGKSDYAALYYPQIQVYDAVSKANLAIPPSGHVAGIYARVDASRGVHKAPANEVVTEAVGLEYSLSRNEQDLLNPKGVNAIRTMNGNIRVWGARTLGGQDNGEYTYISVRRLLIYLRESIDRGTQWVVFEPNAKPLWKKIIRSVTAFLTGVWRDGALFGDTPEQAFFVKCDETTNPPDVRDLGQVVTEIGVAVVKPAEFVIFRISQWQGNTT